MNNSKRMGKIIGQLAKVNAQSAVANSMSEAFFEIPEEFALVAKKEINILRSYDSTLNTLKKQQKEVLLRLETLSTKITAASKQD